MALKKGIMEADPVLLEPIAALKVTVSDAQIGDVLGELSKRRARINGMTPGRQRRSAHRRGDPHRDALRLWVRFCGL